MYKINGQYDFKIYRISKKLWDFDFACIPGLVGNIVDAEWTNEINIT